MDYMNFEEEIQDKEYFEEKINRLEKRIEEIEKILVNAYKSVSKEKQNDK